MKDKLWSRLAIIFLVLQPVMSLQAQNPTYLCEMRNDVQVSGTVFEFDIYLLQTGTIPFEYAAGQYGILINPSIKNGGIITASLVAGSSDPTLVLKNQAPTNIGFNATANVITIAGKVPPGAGGGTIISNVSPGTRVCRVRLTNSVPFGAFAPNLAWTTGAPYPTAITAYVGVVNTDITVAASHTTTNLANLVLNATANPTITSGPTPVIVHSTGNVYTTQTGKTNYLWSVSAGGSITAGGTTADNSVTITWNTAGAQSVSINYTDVGGPAPSPTVYPVTVNPATLTVTGINSNKIYDATLAAPINTLGASLVGILGGDIVTLNSAGVTGTFADKNVGPSKPVTLTGLFTLAGANAGNYTLTQPVVTGTISAFNLTIINTTANNKIYDRLTSATLNTSASALNGPFAGDVVGLNSLGATGTFSNWNAGVAKPVSTSGFALTGTDAGNYSLTQPGLTADITPAALSITGVTANNKVFDGTTSATLNTGSATLSGVILPDAVTLNSAGAVGTFLDPNVGTGKTVTTTGFSISGTDAGNYSLTQPTLTADITAPVINLTITGVTANNKIYDATASATLNTAGALLVGIDPASPNVSLVTTGAAGTFTNKLVGVNKTVQTTGFTITGTDASKYSLTQPTATASITPANLTITGVTANNKVYNATTAVTLNTGGAALLGVITGDVVTLNSGSASGLFANKNVGTGKPVTITGFTIGGTDAGNYSLVQPSATADITQASLTVTGVTANNKTYDATTSATLNTAGASLLGLIPGDAVTLSSASATGSFANKLPGVSKPVTITGFSISGTDAGNYTLSQPTATASITAANLTISGVTANNKVFDGTVTATLNVASAALVGVLGGDIVTLNTAGATGSFSDPNVGVGKLVTTTGFTISGTDSPNYILIEPTTTADITPAALITLTITGVTANNKVYDGTTNATINTAGTALVGVDPASPNVTLVTTGATGSFADHFAGTAKPVHTLGFTITGADAPKYTLTQPTVAADITQAPLTVTGVTAVNKVYDGTTNATLNTATAGLSGVVLGDAVALSTLGATGTFADKSAAPAKPVTTTGFSLSGLDAANYTLTQPVLTATITAATLNITGVTANNKVYDATTAATLNTGGAAIPGAIAGDIVTLSAASATGSFANKTVGVSKTVTTAGFSITGADAVNYVLVQPTTTASITAASLTITGVTANNKPYDGTTAATLNTASAALSGLLLTDVVTLSTLGATGTFSDPNVGTGKTVTTSGFSISGTDAPNYSLVQPVTSADITASMTLTITNVTAAGKIYDGTTTATLNTTGAALSGIDPASPNVTLSSAGATGSFTDKNAGLGKNVQTSGFTISGPDAFKYNLVQPVLTANISAATLTVTGVTAVNKVYDGNNSATLNIAGAALAGMITGDAITLGSTGVTGTFNSKNVGTSKPVSVSGFSISGTDAGNYQLVQPSVTADITAASLTVTGASALNKVYDATVNATLNTSTATLNGPVPGDIVSLVSASATGTFAGKAVGTTITVTTSGFSLSGTDAGNYSLVQPVLTANITSATLTITGVTANNKVYDGTTAATLNTATAALSGVITGDAVTLGTAGATGTFSDPNVGNGKVVTTSGFTITGTDASNYSLVQPVTTANITSAAVPPSYLLELRNDVQVSPNVFEFDIFLLQTGTNPLEYAAGQYGILINPSVRAGGTITSTIVAGSSDPALVLKNQNPVTIGYNSASNAVMIAGRIPPGAGNGTIISSVTPGTRLCRVRLTNSVTFGSFTPNLTWTTTTIYPTSITAYVGTTNTDITNAAWHTTNNLANLIMSPGANPSLAGPSSVGVHTTGHIYTTEAGKTNYTWAVTAGGTIVSGGTPTDNTATVTWNTAGPQSVSVNYSDLGGPAPSPAILSVTVNPGVLTVTGINANKIYDGTNTAPLNVSAAVLTGVFPGDVVSLNSAGVTGTFADKNIGSTKPVTLSGTYTLSGANAGNYILTQPSVTGNITPSSLTILNVTANDKVYDRLTAATLNSATAALNGVIGTDAVTLNTIGATASFADKNAGTSKVVTTLGFTLSGTDAGNYNVIQPSLIASITPATLSITGVTASNKEFDGNTTATLNVGTAALSGVIVGDVVTLSTAGVTGAFADPNVGTAKVVTTSGFTISGTDSPNYSLVQPTTTADITPTVLITLTVSGVTANNKVYDGTVSAILNTAGATLAGIDPAFPNVTLVTGGASGSFPDKNVGNGKTVQSSGFTLSGTHAYKYVLTQPSATANITAVTLTVVGVTANNKVYDATITAILNTSSASLAGTVTGDAVSLVTGTGSGVFANKLVGNNKPVTISGLTLAGTDAGNYNLIQPATTANITAATINVTGVTANNKVYDGTTTATLNTSLAAPAGIQGTDAVVLSSASATGSFADRNAGVSKQVIISGFSISGTDAPNYTLIQPVTTANITARSLTVVNVAVNNKIYDATTAATLNTGTAALSGIIPGDAVTLVTGFASASFADKLIGNSKPVTITGLSISGTDAGNYSLVQPTGTANITAAALTVTGVTANNKVYDATTTATLNIGSAALSGVMAGDVVTLSSAGVTGSFANKSIGISKQVTVTGFSISGTDIGNYTLTQPAAVASITALPLTITGVTANNKIFDGNTTATLNTASAALSGVIAGDVVTLGATGAAGSFADPNVGTGKTVTITGFTISGTDALNYSLVQPTAIADIMPVPLIPLTISGVTVSNKVYDGTTAATLNTGSASLVGVNPASPNVTLIVTGATGTFADKNAGNNKTVQTSGFTLGGTDAGKYVLTQPAATANITVKNLTITGVTALNRVYNGTTAATLNTASAVLAGAITGDLVTLSSGFASGSFASKTVGTGKTVTTTGFTISGNDAGNYSLTQPALTANITAAPVTITGVTANNKVYDGTTAATLNVSAAALNGIVAGDAVALSSASAAGNFASKNVGTGKPVTVTGFALTGVDAANYSLTQPLLTANITTATLSVSGVTANNKVYDGTTAAVLNTSVAALTGVKAGDVVNLSLTSATGVFGSKVAGTSRPVTTSGFTISGTDALNYTLVQPSLTADILAANLTITGVTASNKTYDATTAATLNTGSASLSGVVSGDLVTLSTVAATGTFDTKSVGTGKPVTMTGFVISGGDMGNYTLTQPVAAASITAASLTITGVTADNKVFDGTVTATLNTSLAALSGVYAGDAVTLNTAGAAGLFADPNVGTGKLVTTTGFTVTGADAANYWLMEPTATADITPAPQITLTITGATAANKVYDGTTAATLSTAGATLVGVVAPDVVVLNSAGATGTFTDHHAGLAQPVHTSGFTISGADAGKYILTQPTLAADITAAPVTITGVTANNKVYDGTTAATLNVSAAVLNGIVAGDAVALNSASATGSFADPAVGTLKVVSATGFALTGLDAVNYNLVQPVLTADITAPPVVSISITGVTADNKVYDGTSTATLNITSAALTGVAATDVVTLNSQNAAAAFSDSNSGTGKTVTVSGFALDGPDAGKYTLVQPSLTADVTARPVTITAVDKAKSYGDHLLLTASDYTVTGILSGDVISGINITSAGADSTAGAGTYPITVSGGINANYAISYTNGTLAVGKYPLKAAADDKSRVYGSDNPVLTITYSGFRNNDNASALDVPPAVSVNAQVTSNAGTYPIILSGGSDNNYTFELTDGTLTVNKAQLTISADNQTRVYGQANPALTITYSGFVLAEGQDALDIKPLAVTDAVLTSNAGTYDILVSGAQDVNYSFTYIKGILTVNKADQAITFSEFATGMRITQEVQMNATASSGLPVTYTSSNPDIASTVGDMLTINKEGTVIITAAQPGDQNWNAAANVSRSLITLPTFDNIMSLFTPNNDGMNDLWYFPDLDTYGKLQVTVYNRFGQAVYISDSYRNDWDGTWNGHPLPSGSYYYVIKSSEKGVINGVVNIVR